MNVLLRVRAARTKARLDSLAGVGVLVGFTVLGLASPAQASTTYAETTGGQTHSWSNYTNAGGTAGPVYPGQTALAIDCVEQNGFRVADGNTNWYHITGSGVSASADAFYNNGSTSGSLSGTPYVDPLCPLASRCRTASMRRLVVKHTPGPTTATPAAPKGQQSQVSRQCRSRAS